MILVPLLNEKSGLSEQECFPASVAIIAPICVISLLFSTHGQLTISQVLPYLLGSVGGGIGAGIWLHRILGVLILWGGIRYLC